ncbi:MAG: hypothetical protein KF858_13965 [Candidatus Sumerlaeia bacterium]|nr:hypothetical protein [Candidatus Sumerlaeia bacterium]
MIRFLSDRLRALVALVGWSFFMTVSALQAADDPPPWHECVPAPWITASITPQCCPLALVLFGSVATPGLDIDYQHCGLPIVEASQTQFDAPGTYEVILTLWVQPPGFTAHIPGPTTTITLEVVACDCGPCKPELAEMVCDRYNCHFDWCDSDKGISLSAGGGLPWAAYMKTHFFNYKLDSVDQGHSRWGGERVKYRAVARLWWIKNFGDPEWGIPQEFEGNALQALVSSQPSCSYDSWEQNQSEIGCMLNGCEPPDALVGAGWVDTHYFLLSLSPPIDEAFIEQHARASRDSNGNLCNRVEYYAVQFIAKFGPQEVMIDFVPCEHSVPVLVLDAYTVIVQYLVKVFIDENCEVWITYPEDGLLTSVDVYDPEEDDCCLGESLDDPYTCCYPLLEPYLQE